MSTFVSVGNANQPFDRLVDAVIKHCDSLPKPVLIQYGSGHPTLDCCSGVDFLQMSAFEKHVADAKLLIMHAGAGSVIHAVKAGKVPVVMPRLSRLNEHIDDHQVEFVREMAGTGRIVVCNGPDDLAFAVSESLELQKRFVHRTMETEIVRMVRNSIESALK